MDVVKGQPRALRLPPVAPREALAPAGGAAARTRARSAVAISGALKALHDTVFIARNRFH